MRCGVVETARQKAAGYRGLLFGLLGSPIAWIVLHMFDYLWIETACRAGILTGALGGLTGVGWVLLAATLLALAVSAVAGFISYRRWLSLREPGDAGDLEPVQARSAFLARSGFMISALFALLIILTGVPVVFMSPCLGAP